MSEQDSDSHVPTSLLLGHRVARFTVSVPGSKSLANRALICAALSTGESQIDNIPDGDDVRLMLRNLSLLGCGISRSETTLQIKPGTVAYEVTLDCGLAGTTSRFLSALAATRTVSTIIDGAQRLRERPITELLQALTELGCAVEHLGAEGALPIRVHPAQTTCHSVVIRGDVSSQFVSALMMIAPVLEGLDLEVSTPLVSRTYVEMTCRVMKEFGADVEIGDSTIRIGARRLRGAHYVVEPDFSSAAFPIVCALIGGLEVVIPHLSSAVSQGDAYILEIARLVGGEVVFAGADVIVRRVSSTPLKPFSVNLSDCSDLAPIVSVLAMFTEGECEIAGIGFIRGKESNRVEGLATELRKCGAQIRVVDDGFRISGGAPLSGASLSVSGDHRLAMSYAVLATRVEGIEIDDPAAVDKSWPTFWQDMSAVVSVA